MWADPCGTHDVDINLVDRPEALDGALDALVGAGLEIDRARAHEADREGQVLVGYSSGLRVDLFTPSIPFAWEALRSRRRVRGTAGDAYYLSAEAITVFKLLFYRPKDILDVEKLVAVQLVAVQGKDLDAPYIRRWLVEMMGEADPRVVTWDGIVRSYWK